MTLEQSKELLTTLKIRFEKNMKRHKELKWKDIQIKLENNIVKLWSLNEMEKTEGEPDVIGYDKNTDEYVFYDCSAESPKGRRSLCYDNKALESRKEFKPRDSAINMATTMGIELLSEEQYRNLQTLGEYDSRTQNWLKTPSKIRELGGAIFSDYRYKNVFIFHNGAESYYAVRGFRGVLRV